MMKNIIDSFLSQKNTNYSLEKLLPKITDIKILEGFIENNNVNEIYCSSLFISTSNLNDLMLLKFKYGVDIYIISDKGENEKWLYSSLLNFDFLAKKTKQYPLISKKNQLIKRVFDIVFSLIIIVFVLSWIIPILAICIKLSSKGPIFYLQPRAGLNSKYFLCFKLRSMRLSENISQVSQDDDRITKIGHFIRKTSLDELPQFLNVLAGDMSVVGPRPHIISLNDKFDTQVNNYNDRLLARPGITGLSQVTGHRGETITNSIMLNRIRIDLLYIKRWSVGLDLKIILKTLTKSLFVTDKSAY